MTDAELNRLRETDHEQWCRLVDPGYNASCLERERKAAQQSTSTAIYTRAEAHHDRQTGAKAIFKVVYEFVEKKINERLASVADASIVADLKNEVATLKNELATVKNEFVAERADRRAFTSAMQQELTSTQRQVETMRRHKREFNEANK